MGCKATTEVKDDQPDRAVPSVPEDSWYAQKFNEYSAMPFSQYHKNNKGAVIFSSKAIPTDRDVIESSDDIRKGDPLIIGVDNVYALGFLHESALYVEHYWRGRPSHAKKVEFPEWHAKPFRHMKLGVKVFLDGELVPDKLPMRDSLPQCTATYHHSEAVKQWRAVPVPLMPAENHFLLENCYIYAGLIYSVSAQIANLSDGTHKLRVDVVYGCESEQSFCTDFIARGTVDVQMIAEGREKAIAINNKLRTFLTGPDMRDPLPNTKLNLAEPTRCPRCGNDLSYKCTMCNATVCGSQDCIERKVAGYPMACQYHYPPIYSE